MNTFYNGVHPKDYKHLSENANINEIPAPEKVYISCSQHIGAPAIPVVNVGDIVKMGQLIAKADGAMSANIFSSVSGKVIKIDGANDTGGKRSKVITIENDFEDTKETLPILKNPTLEEIINRIKEAGIVGMGGAGFPTHIKLTPPKDKKVDTLIINGAECEPYITCDYRLMMEHTEQVIKGAGFLAIALGVKNMIIGVEANKPDAITRLNHFVGKLEQTSNITVQQLEVKYPQGAEKQLIFACTGRTVPQGGLPYDAGVIVSNVHTAFSTYLAITDGQPLYKRVMTVSGKGINTPSNLMVRVGTPFSFVISQCDGEVVEKRAAKDNNKNNTPAVASDGSGTESAAAPQDEDVAVTVRLVDGGPMMGKAAANDEFSTSKLTSSLLLLTEEETNIQPASNCINCAKCRRACPQFLMPMYIDSYTIAGDYKAAKKYGAMDCIECGSCAFICPAKRPLTQSIRLAKKLIKERNI